jgi:multicomponent K+:H+ antiporter subunit E
MKRILPHPLLSVVLFTLWLVTSASLAPAHIILALLLAIMIPLLVHPSGAVRLARPWTALRLMLVVAWDIIVANVVVARLVLGSMDRPRPAFVEVPLDTRHPYVITLLASIITIVPGSLSVDIDEARTHILVHALDVDDPAHFIAEIKQRYEQPLKEIFRC